MGAKRLLLPLLLLLLQPRGVAGTPSPSEGIGPGSPGTPSPSEGGSSGPTTDSGSFGTTPGGTPGPEGASSTEPEPGATPGVQGDPSAAAACLPICICNLHPGSCDINCCCDPDCDLGCDLGDPRAAFSFCLPGSTRTVSKVCVEKSLIFRNNIPHFTEIVTDPNGYESLLCVQLSDSKLNYFQQPQKVEKSVFLAQYGGPSFIPPSQDQPSFSAFYRAGDPIQTLVASSVLSTLRQPVGMDANELCIDGNPAGFLESKSTSCTRIFTNLSSSCTTDPALDAASYYRNFTILKVPVNMTTAQLMQVTITPVTQPGTPQMDGNTCLNVVSEVIYEIEFNGTHGIQNVSVQFKMTNVSGNSASSLQQRFTMQFWQSRNPSYTLARSGNPGYIIGAPLLSLNSGARQHVTILQSQGDGICSKTLRYKVQFGMNVRTSCQLSISQTMEDGNCSYFQEMLYQALQGMNSPQGLAIIGSADPTQTDQWTSILTWNCSMQAGDCASCCMVPVSLKIQVLWAEVGLQSNPQTQVLGARYWYQCQSLKLGILSLMLRAVKKLVDSWSRSTLMLLGGEAQEHESLSMTMVPLTTVVAFTDMTDWPEPPRSQPSTYWKLPFDFFFPFKMALSGGIGCQGDLTGAFLMSFTLCSILSF